MLVLDTDCKVKFEALLLPRQLAAVTDHEQLFSTYITPPRRSRMSTSKCSSNSKYLEP
jgi:hypothetical protein